MTVKERLLQELECAINAELGDLANEEDSEYIVEASDIDQIAKKTKWYMDLL